MWGKIKTTQKQQSESHNGHQIPAQLLVAPNHIETTIEQEMIHREVDARKQHEQHADVLDIVGMIKPNAGLVGTETARGDGRKGMAHSIELVHGPYIVHDGTQ